MPRSRTQTLVKKIKVEGAGSGGADLITTIIGHSSSTVVTLASRAKTSISSKSYVYGNELSTIIVDVTDANTVTLADPALTSVTDAKYVYGTDNTAVFASALSTCNEIYIPPADKPYMVSQDALKLTKNTLMYGGGYDSQLGFFPSHASSSSIASTTNSIKIQFRNMTFDGGSEWCTPFDDQNTTIMRFNATTGDPSTDGHGQIDNPLSVAIDGCWLINPIGNAIFFYGSDTLDTEQVLSVTNSHFLGGADSVNTNLGRVYVKATNASHLTITACNFIGKKNDGGNTLVAYHGFTVVNATANSVPHRNTNGSYTFANNYAKYIGNLKDAAIECYSHGRKLIITGNNISETNAVGAIRVKTWTDNFSIQGNIVAHGRRADNNSVGIALASASTESGKSDAYTPPAPGISIGKNGVIADNIVDDFMVGISITGDSPKHAEKFQNVSIQGNVVRNWGVAGIFVDAASGVKVDGNICDNRVNSVEDKVINAVHWDSGENDITDLNGHGYFDQMGPFKLIPSNGEHDKLPSDLMTSESYWIKVIDDYKFQLMDARVGGSIVTFEDSGIGDHTVKIRRVSGAIALVDLDAEVSCSNNQLYPAKSEAGITATTNNTTADLTAIGNQISGTNGYGMYLRNWRRINVQMNTIEMVGGTGMNYNDITETSVIAQNIFDCTTPTYISGTPTAPSNVSTVTVGTNYT